MLTALGPFGPNKQNILCVGTSRAFYDTPDSSSPPSTGTRRKRKGTRKGTGTARMIKSAVVRNVNALSARKRKVKTKNESGSGRGNQTERKEMSRLV